MIRIALAPAAVLLSVLAGCASNPSGSSGMRVHVLRLAPGADLKRSLDEWVQQRNLDAVIVLTACGSLTTTQVRLADQPEGSRHDGKREIVSLTGTLSARSGSHLHLAAADATGATLGGHLLEGSIVYTTAEVALGELLDVTFQREVDPTYGYRELMVRARARGRTTETGGDGGR
jgi:predicted DNA-binding protein with PD1-like motif